VPLAGGARVSLVDVRDLFLSFPLQGEKLGFLSAAAWRSRVVRTFFFGRDDSGERGRFLAGPQAYLKRGNQGRLSVFARVG